jgi:hypothetical protein
LRELLLAEFVVHLGRFCLQHRNSLRDGYHLRHTRRLQRGVHTYLPVDLDRNVLFRKSGKARLLHREGVRARQQVGQLVVALGVDSCRAHLSCGLVGKA